MDRTTPSTTPRDRAGGVQPRGLDPRQYSALTRLAHDANYRLVVSFGGGSIPGICGNLALARLLEELGLRQRVAAVWGTSAGAVVGGTWSSGTPAAAILAALKERGSRSLLEVPWLSLIAALLRAPFGHPLPDGLVRGARFGQLIDSCLKVKTFEACETPFRCIACSDDGQFRTKVFSRGPLLPAIISSMSLPGVLFPPPHLEGESCCFYDGGLVEKTPLLSPIGEHGRLGDKRRLLLLATHYGHEARRERARGFVSRLVHSIYALEDLAWNYQLAEARRRDFVVVIMLNPRLPAQGLFDFDRVEGNYRLAQEVFADALQDAKLALTFGVT